MDSESTLSFFRTDPKDGRKVVAIYPIADESVDIDDTEHRNIAYVVAELYINDVIENILQYALKVGTVIMVITLLTAILVGLFMKNTVANPINAIANTAITYVQDRKNGVNRSDHFSSLGIRTGDELENLTDIMADMERDLTEHEEYIKRIGTNLLALQVKMNDMRNNMDLSRISNPTTKDFDRLERYKREFEVLQQMLHDH